MTNERDVAAAVERLRKADQESAEDSWDELHEDIILICDALAQAQREIARLAEVKNLQKGILHYIAFALADDETADPQLAADNIIALAATLARALVCQYSSEPMMSCADEAAFRKSRKHTPCKCAPCRLWRSDGVQELMKEKL